MKYLELLRAQLAARLAERDAALDALNEIAAAVEARDDKAFTADETTQVTDLRSKVTAAVKGDEARDIPSLDELEARIGELEAEGQRAAAAAPAPTFIRKPDAPAPTEVRTMPRREVVDHAMRSLEDSAAFAHLDDADAVRSHLERMMNTTRSYKRIGRFDGADLARRYLLTENDHYRSAFIKFLSGAPVYTPEEARAVNEFRALSIGTDASGGFGIPVNIDPSIILTSQGSLNPFRRISRIIPITNDEWKGVSSAGVSWSVDAEAAAVSDDTPTLAQPIVTTGMARGYLPYSIEAGMDYPDFANEMGTLLLEGYDELQASHFATASTGSNNRGILTALDANTNVEVTPTTDGAFGGVDINKVWGQLPDRFKTNAAWVMNHDVGNEVSSFSTSGMGSFYTVDLSQGNAPQLKGRPVEFSSYFPDFTNTTGPSNILVVGDFRNFVIVDRIGMTVEPPFLVVDVTNNRPTGERGLFAWARFGSNSVNDRAFRLLQNQ